MKREKRKKKRRGSDNSSVFLIIVDWGRNGFLFPFDSSFLSFPTFFLCTCGVEEGWSEREKRKKRKAGRGGEEKWWIVSLQKDRLGDVVESCNRSPRRCQGQ